MLPILILKYNGDGKTLPLLKDLLIPTLVSIGDIEFTVIIFKGVLGRSLNQVIHD